MKKRRNYWKKWIWGIKSYPKKGGWIYCSCCRFWERKTIFGKSYPSWLLGNGLFFFQQKQTLALWKIHKPIQSIYTCSTSPLDREINSFINKIFSRSKLIYHHRPFLFGSSSSSSHESNESSRILTTDHSRAFLENLDRERMQKTLINFARKDDSCVYDPAFLLFALCDLVRADAQVDPKLLISSGKLFIYI